MNQPQITLGHIGWSPDFKASPLPIALLGSVSLSGAPPCSALLRASKMSNEEITRAIDASHPEEMDTATSRAADQLAMMLIHNRHEKREIVNLIRWCLMGCPLNAKTEGPAA